MSKIRSISPPSTDFALSLDNPIFEVELSGTEAKEIHFTLISDQGNELLKGSGKEVESAKSDTKIYRIDISSCVGYTKQKKNLYGIVGCEFYELTSGSKKNSTQKSAGSITILMAKDPNEYNQNMQTNFFKAIEVISGSQETMAESFEEGLDVNVTKSKFAKSPLFRLFENIKEGTEKLKFKEYEAFIKTILFDDVNLSDGTSFNPKSTHPFQIFPLKDSDIYHVIKAATEAFLMLNAATYQHGTFNESDLIENANNKGIFFNDGGSFSDPTGKYVVSDGSNGFYLAALHLIKEKLGAGIGSSFIDARIEAFMKKRDVEITPQDLYVIKHRLQFPLFIELIWSYWHEESMLVQAINAICRRFQNIRSSAKNDPLAEMEITHLLPLNNVLWGYIQDETSRLSVKRRAYEYDHHYGISLHGKAVPKLNSADSRTKFIGAFHNLLYMANSYYKESANKLVEPDPFPLFNAIREVNFIIAEGMHNQYGDLPWTSRVEMLMQQWILSRSEFRVFLPGRVAVPYPEPWMDRIASMNKLQNWTDSSPIDFNRLAVYGEQLLLSIRFGMWNDPSVDQKTAALWAEYFRPQIQGYIHSYKAATGVDLSAKIVGKKVDDRPPSYHLAKRLKRSSNGKMPTPSQNGVGIKQSMQKKEWF